MKQIIRMQELTKILNAASEAYYKFDAPIMTDKQYDDLSDELSELENVTGIVLANSPLHKVQGFILDSLKKVEHTQPMLSAQKTKSDKVIVDYYPNEPLCVSWKEDGATLVVRYKDHNLVQAITRGDGYIGEDVTECAKTIANLPLCIPISGEIEVRGECVISWETYKELKRQNPSIGHPRNIASGALRQLDATLAKDKHLEFKAFNCISDIPNITTKLQQLSYLKSLGFDVVEAEVIIDHSLISDYIYDAAPNEYKYPVDGIIFEINDLAFGKSLGNTAHHPNCMIAYKWADNMVETTFRGIIPNVTRSGVVSLTAEFDPVTIENTTVKSATLHNVDFAQSLQLGIGDTLLVYKANKIIPEIYMNLTKSNTCKFPKKCPCCNQPLTISSKFLVCKNKECLQKNISRLSYFASKKCMNIEGLSESTITKLVQNNILKNFSDFYHLTEHKDEILKIPKMGEKSYNKLIQNIENSRTTSLDRFIAAIGIPLIGSEMAKRIADVYKQNYKKFVQDAKNKNIQISGIGEAGLNALYYWATDSEEQTMWDKVWSELTIVSEERPSQTNSKYTGKTIAITGTFKNTNREKLKEHIESMGAIYSDTIKKSVDYLLVGENAGSKLEKAQKYNIEIIYEF